MITAVWSPTRYRRFGVTGRPSTNFDPSTSVDLDRPRPTSANLRISVRIRPNLVPTRDLPRPPVTSRRPTPSFTAPTALAPMTGWMAGCSMACSRTLVVRSSGRVFPSSCSATPTGYCYHLLASAIDARVCVSRRVYVYSLPHAGLESIRPCLESGGDSL